MHCRVEYKAKCTYKSVIDWWYNKGDIKKKLTIIHLFCYRDISCLSETDHSHTSIAKVRNEWSFKPSPPVYFSRRAMGQLYCIPLGETNARVRIVGCFHSK